VHDGTPLDMFNGLSTMGMCHGNFVFAKNMIFEVMFAVSSGHTFVLSTCDSFRFPQSYIHTARCDMLI